jgi:hypothetical protein
LIRNEGRIKKMINRLAYTKREDGYVISTVKPAKIIAWYGKYETAIGCVGLFDWRIAEGYATEAEARAGHEKYANMSVEEIKKIEWID